MDILIVEDDYLVAMGEALALVESVKKPDLALLNINLADEHKGTDLARTLLAEYRIPSLFISGNIQEAYVAQDATLGFICKPCSPEVLLQSVAVAKTIITGAPLDAGHIPPELTLFRALHQPA